MAYLLQHLLGDTASRLPEQEAICFEGRGFTYSALDSLSNKLARALRSVGVRRGDRVGVYLHKSPASVTSLFGILKAGGVYVPLDASAPAKRVAYLTRDCGIQVLLTSADKIPSLHNLAAEGTPVRVSLLTETNQAPPAGLPSDFSLVSYDEVCKQDDGPLSDPGTIETDLAYILYTSGSTGTPKGVMVSHRTILTFINWSHETFRVTQDDRVTSHAPLHFDLSTFDIYTTVKAGGTVVLVPEKLSIFPVQLVRLLQDERITVTYLVPSILTMMVNLGRLDAHDLSSLRTVLFAGEVFPIKHLRKLVSAIPHAEFYNLYGPTETNVCTYYRVQPKDLGPERTQPVPIGKACENIEVLAVDDSGSLITEPGMEGELWVRGPCVAQGYWGDPEKTEKVFVRNPFQPNFQEVACRTGDTVVLDEDGSNWIYVGRRDHMIKSRGFRIELGEIEAAFNGHESVQEAAAVAVPDELIGSRIQAFAVPIPGSRLDPQGLKVYLSRCLPHYMVPETIEICDRLPKTSTGKIDRLLLASNAQA